jgi:SNARE protein 1
MPAGALDAASPPQQDLLPVESADLASLARRASSSAVSSPARPTPARSGTNTQELSSLLSHHREVQDELANDLAGMAHQLKLNTLHFSGALERDKAALGGMETRLEGNLTGMKSEKTRLGAYSRQGGATTCFVITAVAAVAFAWFMMFALSAFALLRTDLSTQALAVRIS